MHELSEISCAFLPPPPLLVSHNGLVNFVKMINMICFLYD